MSVRLYCGEYLISPAPVHFGMNWCSHRCFYCFANLNKPDRRMENNDLSRMAKWFAAGEGPIEYWYLSRGYPLLVANDSDPLAITNAEAFATLHELCTAHRVPIVYQTKGGSQQDEDRILSDRPTMFYVSVTSDDDVWLRQAEYGAPGFEHRLNLIRRAKAAGHLVVVGLNPLVPRLWKDLPAALDRLRETGASHLWYGRLHLSRFQIAEMPKKHRQQFADEITYGAAKRKPDDELIDAAIRYASDIGFNCYDGYRGTMPDFWRPYFDLGFPYFPTIDCILSKLHREHGGRPVAFSKTDFDRMASIPGVPQGLSIYKEYCVSFGRSLRKQHGGKDPSIRSFSDVHEWYWKTLDYPTPLVSEFIKIAVDGEEIVGDDEGRPMMVFDPSGNLETSELDVSNAVFLNEA